MAESLRFRFYGALREVREADTWLADWIRGAAVSLGDQGGRVHVTTSPGKSPVGVEGIAEAVTRLLRGAFETVTVSMGPSAQSPSGLMTFSAEHVGAGAFLAECDIFEGSSRARALAKAQTLWLDAAISGPFVQGIFLAPGLPSHPRGSMTLLEQHVSYLGADELARYLVGVGWGLALSSNHVAALGDLATVVGKAPAYRREAFGDRLVLQLTENPWDIPEQAIRALEEFLAPLLPTADELRTKRRERHGPVMDASTAAKPMGMRVASA